MRRAVALTVFAGSGLATLAAAASIRRRLIEGMLLPLPVNGMFPNGMAYARWGAGPRTLLYIPGGPGVGVPTGLRRVLIPWLFRPLAGSGYTVWMVARKLSMPQGHTIADMADDYAELIENEFGGKVDLVLGESYGGIIGFYLAARHPERFGHIAIAVAGYKVAEEAEHIDFDFARLLSEGRRAEAGALLVRSLYPDLRVPGVARILGAAMVWLLGGETPPSFASDIMVEAEAERAYDARDVLPAISVPVLLMAGDRDQYFPKDMIEETARLIPDCTLVLYAGKDHLGASTDKRLYMDMLDFVRQRPQARNEIAAGQQATDEQPVPTDTSDVARPALAGSVAG